ncbi:MAG: Swt1 family HEPN domain-containing protein [Gemmatales bacterium]
MRNIDDHVRSFGMSGFIISDELKGIEQRFNLSLGHTPITTSDKTEEYYPQFELTVRNEAAEMSKHYELFYCLEKSIRKLIGETLEEAHGDSWWTSGCIPSNIVSEVQARAQKELDNGVTVRSDEQIDYTTFGELSVIITSNWPLFGVIFSSRRAVEKVMSNLNLIRGPIAHCCPITEDEVVRLHLAVKDWFRMIG